jgi:sulfur-carrier protein
MATSITILYFAALREAFATSRETYAWPADGDSVGALLAQLRARGEPWASVLATGRAIRVAVNHDVVSEAQPIAPGDEVAIFPPVTGG